MTADVVIVGAGVAGLYAAYCCGVCGLGSVIIDALDEVGGQCAALYPEKNLYGVPGYANSTAKEFVAKIAGECLESVQTKLFGCIVENVAKTNNNLFVIKYKNQHTQICETINAQNIIWATGIGEMKPCTPSTITNIDEIDPLSDFVQYYSMHPDLYRGKDVIIVGGGDSAIDCVITTAQITKNMILVHKKPKFTCEAAKLTHIGALEKTGKLTIALESNIIQLKEDNEERKVITVGKDGQKTEYQVDHVIFFCGFIVSNTTLSMYSDLGIEIENNLIKVDLNTMETSVENCYAVGDVITYANKKKNIIPCFFEADRAVRMIKRKVS